ncbi:atrial natriuretic peptide receptor 1 [Rhipicephalus microplus]|uniref:atrial natriuretic peptide receptor 1 n=1 Tax=Rhipicephalus microplus TaxID=6941 RepID=UPI003F6D8EC4
MPVSGGGAVSVTPSACRGRQSGTMRGWALVAAVLLSAAALPEEDSPATPDYVELELGGEPARNRTRWDSRFVDAEGRFLAKIMATFILSKDLTRSFDYRIAKPALDIAIAKVRKLYPHIAFELIGRRGYTSCINNYAGNYAAEEYLGGGVAAFVGPGCSMAVDSVGRLASHWNVPVCTAAGVGAQFEDRTIYGTLVRLALTINALRDAFLQVLRHFGWRHLVVLSDSSQSFFRQLRRALEGLFADPDTGVRAVFRDFDSSRSSVNYTSLLVEGRSYARVFLLAGDGEVIRQLLLDAHDLGMHDGHFAFLTAEPYKNERYFGEFSWYKEGDSRNMEVRRMYEALMILSLKIPTSPEYKQFVRQVVRNSRKEFNTTIEDSIVNVLIAGFYDCIQLYAWALNETLANGGDPMDGRALIDLIMNSTRYGLTGKIHFNANGDRIAEYALKALDPTTLEMRPVAVYHGARQVLVPVENVTIYWPGRRTDAPQDVPECGFLGDAPHCQRKESPTLLIVVTLVTLLSFFGMAIVALLFYRRVQLETQLANFWWSIKWEDIAFPERSRKSASSLATNDEALSKGSPRFGGACSNQGYYGDVHVGIYKGMTVAVKTIRITKFAANRTILLELKQMRDVTHENLVRLVGLTTEDPNVGLVMEYCPRGSLRDLLENESLKLDWTFRYSIINDIVEGMSFLHGGFIGFHGRLKSTACLIDARFVVKISNFGLRELRKQVTPPEIENPRSLLWTAPEHLREEIPGGSVKGDVYSFAIILQEILTRSGPFENLEKYSKHFLPPEEILFRVKLGSRPPFRPDVTPADCPRELLSLMKLCWNESPALRPSFAILKQLMRKYTRRMGSSNLLDNLLQRMEQYANNLEQLVEEKTAALVEEKRKSDELLYEVLPRSVAEQLKRGEYVQPEAFECATICFSDIVGFTAICAHSTPIEVVDLLNDLYSCFDAIIINYDVFKVETIGDAYMVVSGLPVRNGKEHAREIGRMTLSLLTAISGFRIRHQPSNKLRLRIGVHSGPCAAGVVGLKRPRYCLFGDSVNTASRMESCGEAMKIHITRETKRLLDTFGTFRHRLRGDIYVKGKGMMRTYFLEAEDPPFSPDIGLQGTFFTNEHLMRQL